ncbi:MAG TPA: ornithine carbamoyltransferase [Longimicrobiales bacterium]|nr:ornithine carbamoyltransferase [Longimicrobiales bacterium]
MTSDSLSPSTTAKRDFLAVTDLDRDELLALLDRAGRMKRGEETGRPLAGKTLAMIFRKSSTRTRVSFEVGTFQLGGHALFLSDQTSQMGRGESVHDTAHVLSGMVDGIMIRTFSHEEVVEMASHASVPVINGLTDLLHPCQLLADLQTMQEETGGDLSDAVVAWIGDGNNMAHSWLNAASVLGFELRLACPEGYDPDPEIVARARERTRVLLTRDPAEAAEGTTVVTTDVWASMGQEEEAAARMAAFEGFCVDEALMARARAEAIFLHCLPAHRGEEVTAGVIDGPASRVFVEAENRLHAQKALLAELMG